MEAVKGCQGLRWCTGGPTVLYVKMGIVGRYQCAAHHRRSAHHFFNYPPVVVFKGDVNRINS